MKKVKINFIKSELQFLIKVLIVGLLFISLIPTHGKAQLNNESVNDSIQARKNILDIIFRKKNIEL